MPTLHIRLLGELSLVLGDTPVSTVNTARLKSLLAYLLLHRHTPQSRQHLAFLFWPDSDDAHAHNNLRQAIHRLRQALPEAGRFVYGDEHTVRWLADSPFTLDVAEFESAVEQADSLASLQAAVSLYRGELLPGCYDDWILPERERLQQEFWTALERLILMLESHGDYRSAIRYAELLLRSDPLRETTYRRLIRLYALSGERTGAVRIYQMCVKVLRRELGVDPSPETQVVYRESQMTQAPLAPSASSAERRTNNLPTCLTSFIGREEELDHLKRMLSPQDTSASATRLLTLTGAGGCGKTRLAIQVARELADEFADGVWFVDVATLTDPTLIPHAIASVLGIREQPGCDLLDTIAGYLQSKKLLLIFDNCEYVATPCARIVESLLRSCPQLPILATSREKLEVVGGRVWPVSPLPVPNERDLSPAALLESAAIRLFVERARSAWPTFSLNADNATAVAQICRRLEGLPLAIELAAVRVTVLTPVEIAARLDNAFQLPAQTNPSTPRRHQTLRATMDWSYELLSEKERLLFRRLSVFVGSFTLEAVETVCADQVAPSAPSAPDILDLLSRLIDKSLVVVSDWKQGDLLRYRLLQPTWQYAHEKLSASDDRERVGWRHLEFYMTLAEAIEPHFRDTEQSTWFNRLMAEHDNLMAALDWSLKRGALTMALRLTAALWYFWLARDYYAPGIKRLMQAISLTQQAEPSEARARALWAAGAVFLWSESDCSRARPLLEEAVAIGRALGKNRLVAAALGTLGAVAYGQGDYAAARRALTESVARLRELDDEHSLGWSLTYLGDLHLAEHDIAQADRLYTEGIGHFKIAGDMNSAAYGTRRMGVLELAKARPAQAEALFTESLALNHQLGYRKGIAASLAALAGAALGQGQPARAAKLLGACQAVLNACAGRLFPTDQVEHDRTVTALRAQLEAASLDAAWAEGQALTVPQAIAFALKTDGHLN